MSRPKAKPTRARFALTFTVDFERELPCVPAKRCNLEDLATHVLRSVKAFEAAPGGGDVYLEPGTKLDVRLVHGKRAAKGGGR